MNAAVYAGTCRHVMQACDVGMLTRMLTRIIRSDVTHHSAIVRGDNCFHKTPKIVTMRIPVTESNTLTFKVVLDTYIMTQKLRYMVFMWRPS